MDFFMQKILLPWWRYSVSSPPMRNQIGKTFSFMKFLLMKFRQSRHELEPCNFARFTAKAQNLLVRKFSQGIGRGSRIAKALIKVSSDFVKSSWEVKTGVSSKLKLVQNKLFYFRLIHDWHDRQILFKVLIAEIITIPQLAKYARETSWCLEFWGASG